MERKPDPQWKLDQIGQDLQSPREVAESPVFGHGASFEVGDHQTQLEVFPRANHIDLRTRKLLVGLSKIDLVGSDPEGGLILASEDEDGKIYLWLSPDGYFILHSVPPPTLAEAIQASARPGQAPPPTPLTDSPGPSGSAPIQENRTGSPEVSVSPEIGPNSPEDHEPDEIVIPDGVTVKLEKQPKANYLGRAGRKIIYKQRKDYKNPGQQILVCEFMMHLEDGTPKGQWLKVSAFRKDAERCQAELKAGGAVSLVGYKHVRSWTDSGGKERIKEEIYAGFLRVL